MYLDNIVTRIKKKVHFAGWEDYIPEVFNGEEWEEIFLEGMSHTERKYSESYAKATIDKYIQQSRIKEIEYIPYPLALAEKVRSLREKSRLEENFETYVKFLYTHYPESFDKDSCEEYIGWVEREGHPVDVKWLWNAFNQGFLTAVVRTNTYRVEKQ